MAPHDPFDLATLELGDARLPPAWMPTTARAKYLLGTDDQGRDILSALMYGARISLVVGLVVGAAVGAASACRSGLLAGFVGRLARRVPHARVRRDAVVSGDPGRAADRRASAARCFPNAHGTAGVRAC